MYIYLKVMILNRTQKAMYVYIHEILGKKDINLDVYDVLTARIFYVVFCNFFSYWCVVRGRIKRVGKEIAYL